MANSYLSRSVTGQNTQTYTFSCWVKRSSHISNANHYVFSHYADSNNRISLALSNDTFTIYAAESGSTVYQKTTNRLLRDTSAWYHIVAAVDTTQGTGSNRVRVYINGVEETSFSTDTVPSQNATTPAAATHYVGSYTASSNFLDGYMSHVAFVDGQQLTPTSFGQTDSTSGIWKFKSPSGLSWGTNGFHLKFENSGNLGLDSSGQTNNFTVNGNLKQSLDTPSNNHVTYNFNQNLNDNNILSDGATTQKETSTVGQRQAICNMGAFTGKWYAEFKMINLGPQNGSSPYCGALSMSNYDNDTYLGNNGIAMHPGGNIYRSASVIDSQTSITYTTNSIVSVALDITNNKCHFRVNGGTWLGSGDPVNNTGGYDISSLNTGDGMTFASSVFNNNCQWSVNFGDGFFGTTAITSAGSNGNGSLFEYDVPSGFYALNTKNLNTYG